MPKPSPAVSGGELNEARVVRWEAHTDAEFQHRDADEAMTTMTDDPSLVHVPIGAGANGWEALHKFYAEVLVVQMPDDITLDVLTRTVSGDRLIEEFVLSFTHSLQMDWILPGRAPTAKRLVLPHVAVIDFVGDLISAERIWWDQGTVLQQLGMLPEGLPVLGASQADRVRDPSAPANPLM